MQDWQITLLLLVLNLIVAVTIGHFSKNRHKWILNHAEISSLKNFTFKTLFEGRLERLSYFILSMVITILFYTIGQVIIEYLPFSKMFTILHFTFTIPMIINIAIFLVFQASLNARRLHDINLTGWLTAAIVLFVVIYPVISQIMIFLLILIPGTVGENIYGKLRANRSYFGMLINAQS